MLKNNITNIIALPFAGGNQYSYNSFINSLPSNFALRTVEFPGRGDRLDERNLSDIRELANDVLGQIRKYISEFDYLIYGHSMGTLVGYELAKLITRLKLPRPSLLFFTEEQDRPFLKRIVSLPFLLKLSGKKLIDLVVFRRKLWPTKNC